MNDNNMTIINDICSGAVRVQVLSLDGMGCYEWQVLYHESVAAHSNNAGYGTPEAALRDALIEAFELPDHEPPIIRSDVWVETLSRYPWENLKKTT